MKPIQLTEEQKAKLLEMTRYYFSEYDAEYLDLNAESGLDINEVGIIILYDNSIHQNVAGVHWFEFCMTKLANRLFEPRDLMFYQTTGTFIGEHIVDYCYNKFKDNKDAV